MDREAALARLSEPARAVVWLHDVEGYTHEEIARKLGKSRTVITEALSLNRMPETVQERCRQADIESKSMLLQIVRQDTEDAMHQLVDRITGPLRFAPNLRWRNVDVAGLFTAAAGMSGSSGSAGRVISTR